MLYRIFRPIIKFLFTIIFFPKVEGKQNLPSGGFVYAGNHMHALDPCLPVITTKRTISFLAKEEFNRGFFGSILRRFEIIIIDRNSSNNKEALNKAVQSLKDGSIIGIFPEGTRNKTENLLQDFKYGAVSMAKKANVPVVPFVIDGEYKLFGRGKLKMTILEPIDISKMNLEDANKKLYNRILMKLKENI